MGHDAIDIHTTREEWVVAAAMALMQHETLGVQLAGVETAAFVKTVRPIFRRTGHNFSEAECAQIQHELRRYAAFLATKGRLPVVSLNGKNPYLLGR